MSPGCTESMVLYRISFFLSCFFSYGLRGIFLELLRYTIAVVLTEVSTLVGEGAGILNYAVSATEPLVRKRPRPSASNGELETSENTL